MYTVQCTVATTTCKSMPPEEATWSRQDLRGTVILYCSVHSVIERGGNPLEILLQSCCLALWKYMLVWRTLHGVSCMTALIDNYELLWLLEIILDVKYIMILHSLSCSLLMRPRQCQKGQSGGWRVFSSSPLPFFTTGMVINGMHIGQIVWKSKAKPVMKINVVLCKSLYDHSFYYSATVNMKIL